MTSFLTREEQESQDYAKLQPQHLVFAGAGLEILREVKQKLESLEIRMIELEKKLDEKIPDKALTEAKFKEETEASEDIVNKIITEVRAISKPAVKVLNNSKSLTRAETKKIETITNLLQTHHRLSSTQLAQLMGLSRTRANEYLKQMEDLALAKGIIIGKEKYYQLV